MKWHLSIGITNNRYISIEFMHTRFLFRDNQIETIVRLLHATHNSTIYSIHWEKNRCKEVAICQYICKLVPDRLCVQWKYSTVNRNRDVAFASVFDSGDFCNVKYTDKFNLTILIYTGARRECKHKFLSWIFMKIKFRSQLGRTSTFYIQ